MLNVLDFAMYAQQAVEAPGDLVIDERLGQRLIKDLTSRGHKVEMRTRYGSGAAPVAIRFLVNGVIEAGADP